MKKLLVRSISGAVYVALIVGAIFLGYTWFAMLMSLFAVLAVIEFENILDGGRPRGTAAVAARVLDTLVALATVGFSLVAYMPSWMIVVTVALVAMFTLLRFTLALYDKGGDAFRSAAWSVMSVAYIALPLAMLSLLYCDRGHESAMLVLATFIMIWLNDTGAFCVGSLIGKRRLFERLSPKKSWEGFFGGLACCVGAGIACHYLLPGISFGMAGWIAYGVMVCILSTWGDLFESLMKRTNNIKDSGKLIPGHGGILDRIDSLLFVSVGSFIFYNFFY